jgi:hypothetical protein
MASSRPERLALAGLALLSLAPLVLLWGNFSQLFFFGDELDLISQIDRSGVTAWIFSAFAENIVPLFKAIWSGVIFLSNGSYAALIGGLWLTHAFNVYLFGFLLLRFGIGLPAAAVVLVVFGVSAQNLETLAWTVQWSAVLAMTFLLLGALTLSRSLDRPASVWGQAVLLALCAAASSLCFSRGVLTGFALAAVVVAPWLCPGLAWRQRWILTAAAALPSLAMAIALGILINTGGRPPSQEEFVPWQSMGNYAFHTFALNPTHHLLGDAEISRLLDDHPIEARRLFMLGAFKTLLIAAGLLLARPATRPLLWLLLAFQIGDTLLLGIGRHHTGLATATSSRYQYASLITTLPFAAVALDRAFSSLFQRRVALRWAPAAVLCLLAGFWVTRDWLVMELWSHARGPAARERILSPEAALSDEPLPDIPWLTSRQAHELAERFNLH